jgi:hypothetical protein
MILPGLGAGLREQETRSRLMICQARCLCIVVLASMAGGCSADVPVARSANAACSLEIHDDDGLVSWRILALDGADAPAVLRTEQPARLVTGAGETVDVEIQAGAGDFRLLVRSFNDFEATIRVRPSS